MKIWWLPLLALVAAALAVLLGATVSDVLVGAATSILAAWLWTVIDDSRRRVTFATGLKGLTGDYRVRRKGDRSTDYGMVRIELDGTLLRTRSKGKQSAGAWVGELVMNGSRPTAGSGAYHHTDVDGWGMHMVQVRGRELLVHAEYVSARDGKQHADAYVWEPIDAASTLTPATPPALPVGSSDA
jgi:hypothetical protein